MSHRCSSCLICLLIRRRFAGLHADLQVQELDREHSLLRRVLIISQKSVHKETCVANMCEDANIITRSRGSVGSAVRAAAVHQQQDAARDAANSVRDCITHTLTLTHTLISRIGTSVKQADGAKSCLRVNDEETAVETDINTEQHRRAASASKSWRTNGNR